MSMRNEEDLLAQRARIENIVADLTPHGRARPWTYSIGPDGASAVFVFWSTILNLILSGSSRSNSTHP
jgi:hypothetical protein